MANLPPLQFSVSADLSGLKQMQTQLQLTEQISKSVGRAVEQSLAQGFASAASQIGGQQGAFRAGGQKLGASFGDGFRGAIGGLKGSISNIFDGVLQGVGQQLTQQLSNVANQVKGFALDRSALASFDEARAKVSTLTDDMGSMIKMADQVSGAVNRSASQTEVLAASYDVLSAGFSKASDAQNILTASQKAAIGGQSDLNTVSNATTTILNAYGLAAESADKVVNQMIGTQNAGKIVVAEYASRIGNVATTAASAGVGLEELNAFIATATVKGVSAGSSIDGLRQAIASVLKPSQEASEYAAQLGVNFSAAGLRSKGLAGILGDLRAKNADSADSLIKLFGSVEAVAAIMPSAGDGLKDFAKNLETIKGASADDAFKKMESSIAGLTKKNAVLREELSLKFQVATAPLFEAANAGLTTMLESLNSGGVLFEGLNKAAAQFRDFLAQNPKIIATMTAAFTELLNSGINTLQDGILAFTAALRENPALIQEMAASLGATVQFMAQFAQGAGAALASIGQLATGLFGASEGAGGLASGLGQVVVYGAALSPVVSIMGTIFSVGGSILSLFGGFPAIAAAIQAGVAGIAAGIGSVGAAIPPITLAIAAVAIWTKNIIDYSSNWNDVLLGIGQTWQDLINWVSGLGDGVSAVLGTSETFQTVWQTITGIAQALIAPYVNLVNAIGEGLQKSEFFMGIWNGLTGIITGIADAFTRLVGGAINGLIEQTQQLIGMMTGAANMQGGGVQGLANFGAGATGQTSPDQFVGAVLSILEAPSRQGRVDVAQVVSNRVGTNFGGFGSTIRDQAFAPGQFQPFFEDIGKGDIQDKGSAIAALQKKGYSAKQAAEAIDAFFADIADAGKVGESQSKVGGRAYFKGVSEYGNKQSDDFLRNHGENFFHHENGDQTNRKMTAIGSVFGGGGSAGGGKMASGGVGFKGVQVTSAVDASGEPGLDYVVENGRRGAQFGSVTNGRVIETVTNQNWETNLENNPGGQRGYGNQVIVRTIDEKTGEFVDMLYAHLDKVAVSVGDEVKVGSVLGTQGRTGSTTGAHVSLDFFGKDSNQTTPAAIAMRDRIARQLASNGAASASNGKVPGGGPIVTNKAGQVMDNTVVNKAAAPSGAETAPMVQAVEAARAKEDAAIKRARDEAARARKQSLEEQKLKIEAGQAGAVSPGAKTASDRALKELEIRTQYEERLLDFEQKRADLVKARDRKVDDLKSKDNGVVAAAKAMPDFTAQIAEYDKLIGKDKQLRDQAMANVGLANQTVQAEAERTAAITRRNAEQDKAFAAERAGMELAREKASLDNPMAARSIDLLMQRKELQQQFNKELQDELDKLSDIERSLSELSKLGLDKSPEANTLRKDRESLNQRLTVRRAEQGDRLSILDVRQARELAQGRREQEQAQLDKDRFFAGPGVGLRQGAGRKMRETGNVEGANKIEKEAALIQQALGYRQQQLELEAKIADLRSKGIDVSEAEVAGYRDMLAAQSEFDLSNINSQFDTFTQEILPTIQSSVGGFFKDLVSGTDDAGAAFDDMIGNMTSKIIDFAVNQMVSSLFGGMFGGGGGMFGGGGGGGGILGGILGFAGGGIVPRQGMGGLREGTGAIAQALKKEGANSVLAALTPGELILTTAQAQQFLQHPASNEILNFKTGGIVPGAGSAIANSTNNSSTANITLNVAGGGSGDGIDYATVAKMAKQAAVTEIARQKKPRGMMS